MRVAELLAGQVDVWYGDSRMRMMPDDPFVGEASSARVAVAARGNAVTLTYDWYEVESGRQEGLLLLTDGASAPAVEAVWLDSWHQHPAWMAMTGAIDGETISVFGRYGEGEEQGGWHIHLHIGEADRLVMTMDNEFGDGGRYEVVRATWDRT